MQARLLRLMLIDAWCVFAVVAPECASAVSVTEHHNHHSRDGLYIDSAFTRAAAAGLKRDVAFDGTVRGNVYAQPLYIEGGPSGKAMVIAVTESNFIYALDALSGGVLWSTNVGPPVPSGVLPCGNVQPVGISGTPCVDLASRALFFDAMIRNASTGTPKHFLFSLNVDTGNLNTGWPVDVDATARSGSTVFNSLAQGQRGALAIVATNLYVPYGGLYGDCGSYYGWVVGVPLNNPSKVMGWATTAHGGGATELMAGTRRFNTASVAHGRIYVATDNKVYAFFVPGQPVTPVVLTNLAVLPDGTFQFAFSNVSGTNFSVYGTTNLSISFTNWPKLGSAPEIAPGEYRFSDSQQNSNVSRFYRVGSP